MTNLYGRARRITFFKILGILVGIVLVAFFVVSFLFKKTPPVEEIPDFYYLTSYMKGLGYSCENLEKSGSQCSLQKENYSYFFQRFDDGFTYVMRSTSYVVEFKHVKNLYSEILLTTNENALEGYRNKKYICSTDSYLVGNLVSCTASNGEKLTLGTYLGAVESSIFDVKNMLSASLFDETSLFKDFVWKKRN